MTDARDVQDVEQPGPATAPRAGASSGVAVTAVERVLDVFEAFVRTRRPLSLTDLAELTRIPKSSCHAIVATLTSRGYLYSLARPRSLYPTRRLFDLARDILANDPFIERMMPLLERLRDSSRETVILGKRQGDRVIYLQAIESEHSIRYSARPGEFKPLHSSAIGKALLGSLREPELRAQLAALALPVVTGATVTDAARLAEDILEGRRRGYFVTRGENVPDVWAVSTFLTINAETLAVAIAGPRHRMEDNLLEHAQLLVATCSFITRQWTRS